MKENKSNFTNEENQEESTNEKFIIENNFYIIELTDEMTGTDCISELERKAYQDYLRNQTINQKSLKDITYKNLENVFSKRADYLAMTKLTPLEKFTIYAYAFYPQYIEKLCKDSNISVEEFTRIMKNGVRKFLKYQKIYSKNSTNYNYKKKRKFKNKYHKKGGV